MCYSAVVLRYRRVSVLPSFYLKDITRTRTSIAGAVLKARDTAGRYLVV